MESTGISIGQIIVTAILIAIVVIRIYCSKGKKDESKKPDEKPNKE